MSVFGTRFQSQYSRENQGKGGRKLGYYKMGDRKQALRKSRSMNVVWGGGMNGKCECEYGFGRQMMAMKAQTEI